MSRAVMQQALRSLLDLTGDRQYEYQIREALRAITALKQALAEHDRLAGIEAIEKDAGIHVSQQAEPEQEPDGISWLKRDSGYFTAPTPRTWVGLTDEEIDVGLCRSPYALQTAQAWRDGVEWAQAQLKGKNT